MTSESDNPIHEQSKVNLRSEIEGLLHVHIAVIRGYFGNAAALAADRDQALYEALYHCGDAIRGAIEHPDAFKTIADAGRAKGRDIPTRFIDLATKDDAGESTLNDERRASYAAAAMWFATPELTGGGNQTETIDKARQLGGIDGIEGDPARPGIAYLYRRYKPSSREIVHRIRAKNNRVYTKHDYGRDIVQHIADQFKEDDTFHDPSFGDGAFYNALVNYGPTDWSEIDPQTDIVQKYGPKDFLDYDKHVSWVIGNLPFSPDEYGPLFRKALEVADNVVILIRLENALYSARRKDWEAAGFGLKEVAICRWKDAGFPSEGKELAVIHWQRGYKGKQTNSKIETVPQRRLRYTDVLAELASLECLETTLEDLLVAAKDFPAESRSGLQRVLKRLLMALGDEAIPDEEITYEEAAE